VLPLTQVAWGMSAREAGIVQAAFHLGYLTSLFIVGFIADHFGAKRAYITTGVAACLSPWAFVLFADGFWSAVWLHAFTGLCQGGTYTPALALINDHVERSRRGRAMGYLIAGSSAGYAICLAVAGLALKFTDWRGALAAVAVLPVISWVTGLEDDRRPAHARVDADAGETNCTTRRPQLRLHRQCARRGRRLDLLPVVRPSSDPARLVRYTWLRARR
jgi:MFS family permease